MLAAVVIAFIIVPIGSYFHLRRERGRRVPPRTAEVVFLWALAVNGAGLLFGALGHFTQANMIARDLGWGTNNPFQQEVAVANLSLGVVGVCCIWVRGSFWAASAVGSMIWVFGNGVVHLHDMIANNNQHFHNSESMYLDFVLGVALLALFIWWLVAQRQPARGEGRLPRASGEAHITIEA